MAASDYPGRTMLLGFFFEKQTAGTATQRSAFNQELFDKFDGHIVSECGAANPPIDPSARVRAAIAVMAQNAPGGNNRVKARRAVEAYVAFRTNNP
jgi:hypothetical protein